MPEKAPTATRILALKREMDASCQPVRERWRVIAEVRARKHRIEIPDSYRKTTHEVRSHWIGDILRRVKSTLTNRFPTFTVPPYGPSQAAQGNSTLREKWSNAALIEMDKARMPKRPWTRLMDHAITFGMGINKLVYTPHTWHDYPTSQAIFKRDVTELDDDENNDLDERRENYKKGRFPFAWQAVDPRTWWGFYTEGRLRECLEVTERSVGDISTTYGASYSATDQKFLPNTVSEPYVEGDAPVHYRERQVFIEHWDEQWVTYMTADGTVLKQIHHGYGKVPYFPFYGLSNDSAEPGQEMESIVEHIVDIVKSYDNLLTMWENWAYFGAYAMGTIEGPEGANFQVTPDNEGEAQGAGAMIEFRPGEFVAMPPGFKAAWMVPPPVGQDLVRVSEVLRQFIEETIPNVLKGIGAADQAGYAVNQLITAARMVYDPITGNAAISIADMMQFCWWLIENKMDEEFGRVYVWGESPSDSTQGNRWLGLGKGDIRGYYSITCNIESLLPSNLISEGQFGLMQAQAGAIPMRLHRERFLRLPNPDDIEDEVLVEKYLSDPQSPLYSWMQSRALEKAQLLETIEKEQRDAALNAVALPPGIEQRVGGAAPTGMEGAAGIPAPQNLAPSPGIGMPLTPTAPQPAGMVGAPTSGAPSGFPGGRAAGVGIQPNTQNLPGGIPGQ